MILNKKVTALLSLVDDPDIEVFDSVSNELLTYGKEIVANLQDYKETVDEEFVLKRIEILIRRALFSELKTQFISWSQEKKPSLLKGALLLAQYQFPDFDEKRFLEQFDKVKRNVWLELNDFLTPLEQINVINSIFYNYYKLKGTEGQVQHPNLYFINHLLENENGNAYSLGIIYLVISEMLDVPIFGVDLPYQFVLGYFDNLYNFLSDQEPIQNVQFYIDPINGIVYTQTDITNYLKKIRRFDERQSFMLPLNNKEVIKIMLTSLIDAYEANREPEKACDIQQLLAYL